MEFEYWRVREEIKLFQAHKHSLSLSPPPHARTFYDFAAQTTPDRKFIKASKKRILEGSCSDTSSKSTHDETSSSPLKK